MCPKCYNGKGTDAMGAFRGGIPSNFGCAVFSGSGSNTLSTHMYAQKKIRLAILCISYFYCFYSPQQRILFLLFCFVLFCFLKKERWRERGRKREILTWQRSTNWCWLPPACAQTGSSPHAQTGIIGAWTSELTTTQVCALTRNQTREPLVTRSCSNHWAAPARDVFVILNTWDGMSMELFIPSKQAFVTSEVDLVFILKK